MGPCNAKDKPAGANGQNTIQRVDGNSLQIKASDLIQQRDGNIKDHYNLLNKALGQGAFGEVRKAIHKETGSIRAVKIISKQSQSQQDQETLQNEVQILKQLDHPNIVKIFEFFQDEKYFYIVTEFCAGGELFDRITTQQKFSEKQACELIKNVLQAINYCHSQKIVHRDLKPENLLYDKAGDEGVIKIIDFGTSKAYDPTQKMTQKLGTPYYIAPEVLSRKYDNKCDIWSIGVILYILLCGYPPFSGKDDNTILEKVKIGQFVFEDQYWSKISKDAKNLIEKMMTYKPEERYTAQQCLEHPWIKKYDSISEVPLTQMNSYLNNMKSFRATQRMQQAIYMFIFNNLTTSEEKNELLETFKKLDTNNNGKLSKQELIDGYKKIMTEEQAKQEVNEIFQKVDFDKSGDIDYSEFVMASINKQKLLSQERLEQTFKMFDQDSNGSISMKEIKERLKGINQTDAQWKDIVGEVDKNGDGEISLTEFKNMMLQMVK